MVQYVWLLMCGHPESDCYWIELASRSEEYVEKMEKLLHEKSSEPIDTRIIKVQLRGEITR